MKKLAPGIGFLALVLLVSAGQPMARRELPFWGAVALLYGILFWFTLDHLAGDHEALGPVEPPARGPRILPLAIVLPLAVLAWRWTGANRFRPGGTVCWIAAVLAWIWAWAPAPKSRDAGEARPQSSNRPVVLVLLAVILAGGVFFYLHRLAATPANPTSDHAETLLDVMDMVHGERPVFFTRNTGREPWKFYWIYVLVKVFGLPVSYLTMKVATAIIGVLAIPAVFLLGRELGGNALGLFAAALVSWSKWPLAQARVGNRFSYAVFPTALVLWALARWFRRGDRASVLWAGAWIGIGLYGYIPFRVVPLFVPLVAAAAALDPRWRGRRLRLLLDGLVIAATAALVFLPLFHFMVQSPQFFFERMAERSDLSQVSGRAALATFLQNLRNMALAFNWRGDGGWVNGVTDDPFLDVVTGGLFLAGIAVALSRVARGSIRWLVPLAGIFLLTLPSTLILTFAHENPSVNRSVAAVPVVFVLAAVPLAAMTDWLRRTRGPGRLAGFAGIALLLALSGRESYRRYFVDYHRQYSELVEHTQAMAHEIEKWNRDGIPLANAYVLNAPFWLDPRNVAFELGKPDWAITNEIRPGQPPPRLEQRPLLFLVRPSDLGRRAALRRLYPEGEERVVAQDYSDRNFSIYLVR